MKKLLSLFVLVGFMGLVGCAAETKPSTKPSTTPPAPSGGKMDKMDTPPKPEDKAKMEAK